MKKKFSKECVGKNIISTTSKRKKTDSLKDLSRYSYYLNRCKYKGKSKEKDISERYFFGKFVIEIKDYTTIFFKKFFCVF